MKSSLRNIGVFLFLIFIIITIPLAYSLYDLQAKIASDMKVDIILVKQHTDVTIMKLLGFFVVELFVGGLGIFFIFKEKMSKDVLELDELYDEEDVIITSRHKRDTENQEEQINDKLLLEKIKSLNSIIDIKEYTNKVVSIISKSLEVSQGALFVSQENEKGKYLSLVAGYAYFKQDDGELTFKFGEGLAGQAAKAQKIINIKTVPDGYIQIISGLGASTPNSLLIVPMVFKNKTLGVMELASFKAFTKYQEDQLSELIEVVAIKMNELTTKSNSK